MLRLIALFILIYLAFRIVTTWLLPRIVRWYIERQRNKFYRANPHAEQAAKRKKRGDMHISYTGKPGEADSDKLGEYVDFEDIKDDNKE